MAHFRGPDVDSVKWPKDGCFCCLYAGSMVRLVELIELGNLVWR